MRACRLIGPALAALIAALALAPGAAAAAKVELGAEVLSLKHAKHSSCGHSYPGKIKVTDHGKPAGVINVKRCIALAADLNYFGSANLTVGRLTGPAKFSVGFHAVPPNFTEPTSGTGSVNRNHDEEKEELRVKEGSLPSEVGARFQLVLYPSASG